MSDYFNLPEELFLEILLRVPAEDLVKLTAVCKSWNSLIKNPTFISTHLEKTISSTNTHPLLFGLYSFNSESVMENYSLRFDNEDLDEYKQLLFRSCKFGRSFRVVGSYNGLVCLVYDVNLYDCNFILWNPTIKKSICVPTPGVTFDSYGSFGASIGFGFDCKTNDYKLLRYVELGKTKVEVEIYSLNANCWRSITHIAPKYNTVVFNKTCSFVNGAIHMLACDLKGERNLILAFDVSEEVFREIPLPDCLSNHPLRLHWTQLLKYGQSIAAVTWERDGWDGNDGSVMVTLCVMKEYGVAMSWTTVLTEDIGKRVRRMLFFRNDEEVFMLREDRRIASLDINSKLTNAFEFLSFDSARGYTFVDRFVESLVLLDKGNACGEPEMKP